MSDYFMRLFPTAREYEIYLIARDLFVNQSATAAPNQQDRLAEACFACAEAFVSRAEAEASGTAPLATRRRPAATP